MAETTQDPWGEFGDEVRCVTLTLIDQPDAVVPAGYDRLLGSLALAASASKETAGTGEIAHSLATLVRGREGQCLDEQLRQMIVALGRRLLEALGEESPSQSAIPPLVTPIAPSQGRSCNSVVILIDDDAMFAELKAGLNEAGFVTRRLRALEELEKFSTDECCAAIVARVSLFQLNPLAGELFAKLQQYCVPQPHLFLLARSDDIAARLDAVRLGATRCLSDPPDVGRLTAVLRGVTDKLPARPFRVLLVDDDRMSGQVHQVALEKAGLKVERLVDPLQAPYRIGQFEPDVILTDLYMAGCNGLELLALLRQDDALADTPIIILTSEYEPGRRIEALQLGADDYLIKPVPNAVLSATVVAHARRSRRLKRNRLENHGSLAASNKADGRGRDAEEGPPAPALHAWDDYEVEENPPLPHRRAAES